MHPRLQKQTQSLSGEALLLAVDKAYREADESIRSLTAMLQRTQDDQSESEARKALRQKRAAKAARRLERAMTRCGMPIFELNAELVVQIANPAAERLCAADPVGKPLLAMLEPLQAEMVAVRWHKRFLELEPVAETLACSAADHRGLTCDFVLVPKTRKGKLEGVTALVRDETQRAEAQEARREREERMALALGFGTDIVWDWDLRLGKLHLSPRWRDLVGEPDAAARIPSDWIERVHPDDQAPFRAAISAHIEGQSPAIEHEHRVRHQSGDYRWVWVRGAAIRDKSGMAIRATGLMTDVTRHRALVERMAHDARHDSLTGLCNRMLFLDLLRHSLHRTRRHADHRFAVLFIDIDRFKTVNDTLGHQVGDELLVQIARRLETCLRQGDTLARHAGDEFTMRLDDVRDQGDAVRVADRVHEVMREPFQIGMHTVRSSASIGIAVGSAAYSQAEEVLRDADSAMYRAKGMGTGRTAIFDRQPSEATPSLESDLRRALQHEELRVYYMPIVEVPSGKLEGLEALARWQHPRLGLVSPVNFLALAERTGLIVAIDRWVLDAASRQLREWRRDMNQARYTSLSVNFSQKMLEQQDLTAQVEGVLHETRLDPGDVNLDVSESTMETPSRCLGELHRRGLRFNMDDFGTGHCWLRHLHAADVDSVKVDRSYVAGEREVLRRIVSIARELGKKVIAEGVETEEQLRCVREVGCDAAQGFLFSAPLDATHAGALLQHGLRVRA
ncbi:MAG: EAL domain-containing protein [Deltaproteobacteria bacterium]|nr:MAG: EAL domain-containing protein [Deltaproteobacteria bacterium]